MKTRYIKWNTNKDGQVNYIRQYKPHFWSRWKTVISPSYTKPQLYRIIDNMYVAL